MRDGKVTFFFASRRRHTRRYRDWSSDVCSSDLFVSLAGDCRYRSHFLAQVPHRSGEEVALELEDEYVRLRPGSSRLHLLPVLAELPELVLLHRVAAQRVAESFDLLVEPLDAQP